MASQPADGVRALLLAACLVAPAAAQATAPVTFTTADGSRFVLVVEPSMPHVHWAVATWADGRDDPAGLDGLSGAVMRASLGGTWQTGSRDVAAEREALAKVDAAWQQAAARPAEAEAATELARCVDAAAAVADVAAFTRVLATTPADRPQILARDGAMVFVLTTLPHVLGDVGRLLVERREDQALRELPHWWNVEMDARSAARSDGGPAALHTELVALALPAPAAVRSERAPGAVPRREQALTTWAATQRPERTVHVLLGGFDAAAVTAVLHTTFAATALPPYSPAPVAAPKPLTAMRRSVVPGVAPPSLAVAWVLPTGFDREVLAAAKRWLADGPDSRVGQELQRTGRTTATTRCRAPWPDIRGGGLFLIEVGDATLAKPGSGDALLDLVLATCRSAAAATPDAASVEPVLTALQMRWRQTSADPRERAAALAVRALQSPDGAVITDTIDRADGKAIHALLAATFAGQPVAVEGRP